MFIAGGNIAEYNELLGISIEDYLIRFKMFIEDIQHQNKINKAQAKK